MPSPESPRCPVAFRRLSATAAVASLVLVAIGGAVRATDSGLSCPTWPGCFSAGDFLPPADLRVWTEHTHRLVAGLVALLIAAQLGWVLARFRDRPALLWPAVAAAVCVVAQALLGAVVVWLQLRDGLVTTHLGLALALVALLLFLAVAADRPVGRPSPLGWGAVAVAGLAYVQILTGGHLSGVGSGLAYVNRPLLGALALGPITTAQELFNVAHRVLALVLAAGVMWLAARARRCGATGWLARLPRVAAALVTVQIALGVANLASRLSFVTVIPHLAVASWIWAVLVLTVLLASPPPVAPAPQERRALMRAAS